MIEEHRWTEFAASYALDALDDAERAEFEAHLAECAACRAEVRANQEVTALLAHGAAPSASPSGLRDRILSDARKVRPIGSPRAAEAAAAPVQPQRRPYWIPAALAASVLFALVSTFLFSLERRRGDVARADLIAIQDSLVAQQAVLARLDSARATSDSLLATLLAQDVRTVHLTAQGQPPSARIYWNRRRGVVVLAAFDLPPAAAGRTYQLWGIAAGRQPVSLGTFDTQPGGQATVTLAVDPTLEFSVGAVTEEPAGGSPQPTSAPFLIGSVTDG